MRYLAFLNKSKCTAHVLLMLKLGPSGFPPFLLFKRRLFSTETRFNPLNIQILGKSLTEKVFPGGGPEASPESTLNRIQMQALELSRRHLDSHSIPWQADRPSQILSEISGEVVPALLASNLRDHFAKMAADLSGDHFKLALTFAQELAISPAAKFLPQKKDFENLFQSKWDGWIRWDHQSKSWMTKVDEKLRSEGPEDSVIVFDVETCPLISQFPVLASAYGPKSGWSFWLSSLDSDQKDDMAKLIPLKHPTLVIGHHVAFDRARIRDEYCLTRGSKRFLDTLSMHCAVAGLSSQQRGLWQERKKKRKMEEIGLIDLEVEGEEEEGIEDDFEGDKFSNSASTEKWGSKCSLNNLVDALQLHCGRKLDKSVRDEILLKSNDINEISAALPEITEYCARDVEATAQLFSTLFPKFLQKSPSPVTFTALLEMNTFILPLSKSRWTQYLDTCDGMLEAATTGIQAELKRAVDEICEFGLKNWDICKNDPWLSQLDWTVDPIRFTKARYLKDGITFAKGGEPRPIGNSQWAGKPAWYKKLVKGGAIHVTPRTSIVPLLLKLKWKGAVVHLIPENGWCFEIVNNVKRINDADRYESDDIDNAGDKYEVIQFNGKKFQRIPHPGGRDENVGCLLTKNFLKCFQSGDLSNAAESATGIVEKVLEINSRFSFWTGYRERVREQFVVSTGEADLILPTVQPMGTVTRRAVEKTWMTASNAKESLVGSELKAMISAPQGWCFVGADVDSQELWIGSLLGDAQFGWSGSTALGWMNLQGSKSDGSDLHSRTAKILGMTRDNAKIFNYGRIYGAGVKYAAQLLMKFNPKMSPTEAASRASELYHATKGRRIANRRDAFVSYAGGTESFMFNQMEAIAKAPISRTPVLSAEISDALISAHVDDNFITSRVNWVVQSSGVDYLHMLLVAVAFLFKHFSIPGRVAITIHDEVRFLVPEDEKFRAALALQIANLWTRAAFVQAVGVQDLPLSVAFFSAVDVDSVLRKEVHLPCLTPSNKSPIPPGQAFDIYKLLKNCSCLGISSHDTSGNSSANSNNNNSNFMYKYYLDKRPPGEKPLDRVMNFEEEQKYLSVLKRQMQKPTDALKGDPKISNDNARQVNSLDTKISTGPTPRIMPSKGEIFDRWNNLIKKQKSNQP